MSNVTKTTEPAPAGESGTEDKDTWGEFLKTVIYALLIAVTFRTVAFEPFNIPSESMLPTLLVGDHLLVSKTSYGYSRFSIPFSPPLFEGRIFASPVERGDVAVFRYPGNTSIDYIKRIVGVPGDKIMIINDVLFINDKPVERQRVHNFVHPDRDEVYMQFQETLPNGVSYNTLKCKYYGPIRNCDVNTRLFGPVVVPDGHYFAMGDNRDNSLDSRIPVQADGVGFVPFENFIGRADVIFFSTCGSDCNAPLWKPWNWFSAMRYDRIFNGIE